MSTVKLIRVYVAISQTSIKLVLDLPENSLPLALLERLVDLGKIAVDDIHRARVWKGEYLVFPLSILRDGDEVEIRFGSRDC